MKQTRTQSPSTDADRARDKMYSRSGQILFQMSYFKTFVKRSERPGIGRSIRSGAQPSCTVNINGLSWQIMIKACECAGTAAIPTCIDIGLHCLGDKTDMAWSCRAAAQFSVVSFKKSGECLLKRRGLDSFDVYTANCVGSVHDCAYTVEELMDPENGFYDEKADTVTFKAEIVVEEPIGMPGARLEDTLLINGEFVNVNKHLLAGYSKFFRILFFGENAEEKPNIQIDDVPNAVANFERLIATMCPQNEEELDDFCVEGVLLLANRFLLDSVVNRCVEFLLTKSKKSAICKFRLAHQCGIIGMKEKILKEMTKEDFAVSWENYMDNCSEVTKMGAEAMNELSERHTELLETE
uniref:BTB domain-containing protein n=1 Tax=Globodera pallida TaxID=36090 RepID=A0A183BRK3_GLOPA